MAKHFPHSSLVRIWCKEALLIAGAGFIVTPEHVLACAHVINSALGRDEDDQSCPDEFIFLDFLGSNAPKAKANVAFWFPVCESSERDELEDIAVLNLIDPLPTEVCPIPLPVPNNQPDQVKLCGFPEDVSKGTYVTAKLQGTVKNGWIEVHPEENRTVDPGFSGAAAWDMQQCVVCGMIVSRQIRIGGIHNVYMIPAKKLINVISYIQFKKIEEIYDAKRYLKAYQELHCLCCNNQEYKEFTLNAKDILTCYDELEQVCCNKKESNLTQQAKMEEKISLSFDMLMHKLRLSFPYEKQSAYEEQILFVRKNRIDLRDTLETVEKNFEVCMDKEKSKILLNIQKQIFETVKYFALLFANFKILQRYEQ